MKDLYPIGTVVVLKNGEKRLMITGYLQKTKEEKIYDYAACLWPEGYMDREHNYVFNHEDIDRLYFIGLQDIEQFKFKSKLDEIVAVRDQEITK